MQSAEETARGALARALPPSVAMLEEIDGEVTVLLRSGVRIPLVVRWAGAGYPRDVDRALRGLDHGIQAVLVAETFSPGSREMLAERGVGWVGLDGSMLIELGGAVYVERHAAAAVDTKRAGAISWTPSAADVAETLLSTLLSQDVGASARRVVPLVEELAAHSGRSLGAVSRALREFEGRGWIDVSDGGERSRGRRPARSVSDPAALLDGWAGFERTRAADRRFHVLDRDPEKIAARICDVLGVGVVFGGLIAADRIAPYSTGISVVRCYIDEATASRSFVQLAQEAGLTPSDAGARVIVSTARRPVFETSSLREGLRIVGPIRAYLDLLRDSVRGEDPAEHLRRIAIGF